MSQTNQYFSILENQLNELLNEDINQVANRENTTYDRLTSVFGNQIVLFGAGGLGRKTLAGLRKIGKEPLAFADNNPNLWNTSVDGIPVLSLPEAASQLGQNATFIITIWRGNGGDRQADRSKMLQDLNCINVISFGYLFWKYPEIFLPHGYLDLPSKFLQNADDLRTLFYLWADDDSRHEYIAQLRFRIRLDFDGLTQAADHKQYFPNDLYSILPEDIVIDCGAFDGDTIRELLQQQPNFAGKVFAFEPDKINFDKLQKYISTLPEAHRNNIVSLRSPVGKCGQEVHFFSTGTVSSAAAEDGEKMKCICIDEHFVHDRPSFVKMDIESAEVDALMGARKTIQHFRPILAICVYHKPDHLWKIPLLISSYVDNYRFFLRPHDSEGWELVCYAIPEERLSKIMPKNN